VAGCVVVMHTYLYYFWLALCRTAFNVFDFCRIAENEAALLRPGGNDTSDVRVSGFDE